MIANQPASVARDLRTLLDAGAVGTLTDRQLLDRFVERRDPSAFSALVDRHGPMVWGVCRRILRDPNDAADSFQATFLVLVRKAGSVRVDGSLAPWLHGVGRKVASRARATAARRAARERPGVEDLAGPVDGPDRSEALAVLDEEIGRLPERYRSAVVLCDLEQVPHEEAARRLGCAVGTIGSRLSRARDRLRDRLTRRGLAPVAGSLGALLVGPPPPATLVESAASLASLRISAGGALKVSANVSALAKGMLPTMTLTRRLLLASLAVGATSAVAVLTLAATQPRLPARPAPAAGDSPKEDADAIRDLMEETYTGARTYQDEGESVTVFLEQGNRRTVKKPFRTRYARPSLYRYQFTDHPPGGRAPQLYVIWSDDAARRAKSWWTLTPEIKEDNLAMAIGAAVGVSSSTSSTIPSLLMPDLLNKSPLLWLTGLKLVGEENIDGSPCHKIECRNFARNPETIWIDKETHLLRRIFEVSKFPGFTTEETTTYRPRINLEIPADQFGFEPPKP